MVYIQPESESCSVMSDSLWSHGILKSRILEWLAFPFSRGSSKPRDGTQVSCIAGGFFTSWVTREALFSLGKFTSYLPLCLWILSLWNENLKKDAQIENCELKNEDCSPGGSISDISERLLLEEQWVKVNIQGLGEGGVPWSIHFTKGFLLVTRIWCHHQGI